MTSQSEVKAEISRRRSQSQRLLEAFRKHGELTTRDLQRIGTGVSSRVHELRSENHKIVTVYEKPGLYRYIYIGEFPADGAQ